MKALLAIDLQLDFFEGGALGVPKSLQIIPNVNRLIEATRNKELVRIHTRDFHPPDTKHFDQWNSVIKTS